MSEAKRRGALDDRACARLWAEQWARHGYADAAIRAKLAQKGLPPLAVEGAMTRLARAGEDDAARARHIAAAALARRGPWQPERLARLLACRGFDSDLIERLLESFESAISHDE